MRYHLWTLLPHIILYKPNNLKYKAQVALKLHYYNLTVFFLIKGNRYTVTFCSNQPRAECPDWLWGPSSLLFDGYCKLFPQGQSSQSIRLTTQPHLVLRISRVILLLHVYAFVGYTGCHRRNRPNFGRVFLMLNYTDITQNTYVPS